MQITYQETAFDYMMHFHNAHEILYVISGSVRIVIHQTEYIVEGGSLVFISNLEEHSTKLMEAPYRRYFITIPTPQLGACLHDPLLSSIFLQRPPKFNHVMRLVDDSAVHVLFDRMLAESARSDTFTEANMGRYITLLLIEAYRSSPQSFPAYNRPASSPVREAQQYIDQHYAEPISISKLTERYYMSESWLSHIFHREIGISPMQYLSLVRLSAARNLLLNRDINVSDAARQSGFSDVNNFIKRFSQQYGMTPKKFQLRYLER